jgi:two-component system LytT family sensor kinase
MPNRLFSIFSKQILYRHLIAWLSIVIYYTLYSTIEGSVLVKTVWIFLLIVNYSFAYYTLVLFVWPKILTEKKLLYSILILLSIAFFCTFFYFQLTVITPWLGGMHPMIYWSLNEFINNTLKLFSYVLFTSIGTYYNWVGVKKIEADLQIDRGLIDMEFLFLKNQFHSHLTFNFLNFCYNKIRGVSSLTSDSVEEFSDILRYSLSTSADGPVLLEKEIEYIKNYISFQKFLSPNLEVQVNYKGDLINTHILPKSLGSVVEYFFKDKAFNNIQKPIIIFIESVQNEIIFKIKIVNTQQNILIENKELQYIEQLLQPFYNNKYSIQILDNDNLFSCELKLENYKTQLPPTGL